jgi:hypothetical protein
MLGALLGGALGFQVPHQPVVPAGPASLGLFAFVLLWTAFWTLGGLAAGMTALRSVWGVDRIAWDATGVWRNARVGHFGRERFYSRDEIQRVRARRGKGVVLETVRGTAEVSAYGTEHDLAELRAEIEQALSLGDKAETPAELPKGWEAAVDLEGIPVLQKMPALRRRQAAFVTAIFLALALAVGVLLAGGESVSNAPAWVPVFVLGLLAAGTGAGAAWLWFGGEAIRLKPAHADVLRWFGSRRWLRNMRRLRSASSTAWMAMATTGTSSCFADPPAPRRSPTASATPTSWSSSVAGSPLGSVASSRWRRDGSVRSVRRASGPRGPWALLPMDS